MLCWCWSYSELCVWRVQGRIPVCLLAFCDGRSSCMADASFSGRCRPDTLAHRNWRGVLPHPSPCLKIPSCLIWRCSSHTCATYSLCCSIVMSPKRGLSTRGRSMRNLTYNPPENKSEITNNDQQWSNILNKYQKYIDWVWIYQIWWKIHAGAVFNTPGVPKSAKLSVVDDFIMFVFDDCAKTH